MLHLACAVLLLCPPPVTAADSIVAFVDVTVIPMDRERSLRGQTVVVRGRRIVAIGPSARVKVPAGGRKVNGRGKFLIPGLAEMHAHIPGGQVPDSLVERTLFLYVSRGITTIRGMLGDPRHLDLRTRAARGELLSPLIYTSGPSLNGNSVPTPGAAARTVGEQKAAGYDFLKIHPGINGEVFDTLVAAAQRQRIRMAGHVPLEVGLERALEAHYATIDHLDGYVEAMVRKDGKVTAAESEFFGLNLGEYLADSMVPVLAEATREAGVWNVPTQVLMENLVPGESAEALAQRPEMRYVSRETLAKWAETKNSLLRETGASPQSARRVMDVRRGLIKALHTARAGLLLGSDAPQIYNVPGFSTHRELQSLVAAGLTPYQALETGTRNVAVFFRTLARTGTIEVGKQADLILLDANPLIDVANTTKQAGVMLRGKWLPKSQIDARLGAIAKAVQN
ncbi:MAG TPA: amidohydrolase family protein [Gemmatimonadales bacterium]|nr:amidohydrolase family protein [Gemmatimonadales bacterium]